MISELPPEVVSTYYCPEELKQEAPSRPDAHSANQAEHQQPSCAAFKKAGFAYVVLTTKHHDGFAMWPSDQGDFNTKNWMNGRDLIKTFVEACRRHELKVGLYFSGQDWYHDRDYRNFLYWQVEKVNPEFPTIRPDLEPHDHPQRTAEQMADCTDIFPHKPLHWTAQQIKERDERYRCFVRGQLEELLTRFGKIDLLWFDSAPPIPERETSIITMDRIRELQPGIVINPRFFKGGDFKSYERTPPTDPLTAPWNEFCDVWTNTWTHTTNEVYKSTAWIVSLLVACRARGMNYLLGIGPNRDGELVPGAYTHIGELGRWLAVHRAAVLNGATQLPDNESANVPATASGSNRFLFALRQFDGDERTKDALLPHEDTDLTLTGATEPAAVTLMADGEPLEWSSDNGTVTVDLPAERRTELGDVVRMNL